MTRLAAIAATSPVITSISARRLFANEVLLILTCLYRCRARKGVAPYMYELGLAMPVQFP